MNLVNTASTLKVVYGLALNCCLHSVHFLLSDHDSITGLELCILFVYDSITYSSSGELL